VLVVKVLRHVLDQVHGSHGERELGVRVETHLVFVLNLTLLVVH
jgi:hypothetical protein